MLASLEELVVVLDAEVVVVAVLDRVTSMSSLEPSIASRLSSSTCGMWHERGD